MRIAYVQDWLTVDGGAEKVTREILALYPEADVFSLIDHLNEEDRQSILHGKRAKTTFLQHMPFSKRHYRYYLPLFPRAIESIDLSAYDLIISGSYAVAKGVRRSENQKHICYCHSPMRYVHDLKDQYLDDLAGRGPIRFLMNFFFKRIREWDIRTADRVDCYVANSKNVQERIQRIYGRTSEVIPPPVNCAEFKVEDDISDFYLASSRQVQYKKTDVIVEAFKQMPDKKLVVTGDGPMLKKIKQIAGAANNISVLGHIPRKKLVDLLSRSRAFIIASHEDLGLAPLEALASGTPVIGYGRGGILETTEENRTAIYFDEQHPTSLMEAVKRFENTNLAPAPDLRRSAEAYDIPHFHRAFKNAVDRCLAN